MTAIIPKISQLSSRVIRVLGCNPGPMTLQGTNTYIIGTGKRRVLLDTGEAANAEYLSNLTKVMKEHSISLETVIISHWHHDHIGGLDGVLALCKDIPCSKPKKFPNTSLSESANDFEYLNAVDELKIEGATLNIIHTPGHAEDHVVVHLLEENALFSGDCILGEGTAVFEDLHLYMNSLQKILDISADVIYPGHGPVIENPNDKISYYINHRKQREAEIMKCLKESNQGLTCMQLVKMIYKDTPVHLHRACASNVSHHLQKLMKETLARCMEKDGEETWTLSESKL